MNAITTLLAGRARTAARTAHDEHEHYTRGIESPRTRAHRLAADDARTAAVVAAHLATMTPAQLAAHYEPPRRTR